jgi:uncharacterized protein (TIGR00369 family)
MKVISKQRNSKMCIICGLDNPLGVKAPFYNMEDNSVMTVFTFREEHQSYPLRTHGGMITAMLDELGMRACWVKDESIFGVTMDINVRFRKPVPYDAKLIGKGLITFENKMFVKSTASIMDESGNILAEADIKYFKMSVSQIGKGIDAHEEMCYLIPDEVKEINVVAE